LKWRRSFFGGDGYKKQYTHKVLKKKVNRVKIVRGKTLGLAKSWVALEKNLIGKFFGRRILEDALNNWLQHH